MEIPYNIPTGTQFASSPAIPAKRFNVQRFNQIVRLAVQVYGTPFASQAALYLKSNWTTLLAATDNTRMILSPPFSMSKISPSKPLQTGPDTNATYNGLPVYFGEGVAEFSATFLDVDQAVIDAFFTVTAPFSMSNYGVTTNSLVAYFCNNDGHIFSNDVWGGIPILNLTPRSRETDGLNSSDKTGFGFYFLPNWDTLPGSIPTPTPFLPGVSANIDLRAIAW